MPIQIAKESFGHFKEKYFYIYKAQGGQGLEGHISEAHPTLGFFFLPSTTLTRLREKPPMCPCIRNTSTAIYSCAGGALSGVFGIRKRGCASGSWSGNGHSHPVCQIISVLGQLQDTFFSYQIAPWLFLNAVGPLATTVKGTRPGSNISVLNSVPMLSASHRLRSLGEQGPARSPGFVSPTAIGVSSDEGRDVCVCPSCYTVVRCVLLGKLDVC